MNIQKSLSNSDLAVYISRQLNFFYPDTNMVDKEFLLTYINEVEERAFYCFSNIHKKYFNEKDKVIFNHLHADQYTMYLYILSRHVFERNNLDLATKLYYLNKTLHSVDLYFTLKLPSIFLFVHPLGSIVGRALFSDYFIMYQGCTVGCLNEGIFPEFNGKAILYAHAQVMGRSIIGDNVCIASGVKVINSIVPDNCIVFGEYPNYSFKENKKSIFERPPFLYK